MRPDRPTLPVEKLKKEQEHTRLKLTRLGEILKSAIDPDVDDGAADLEEHEKAMVLAQELERKLKSIDEVLQQLQQGTYGLCQR